MRTPPPVQARALYWPGLPALVGLLLLGAALAAVAEQPASAPDLTVELDQPMTQQLRVRNSGSAASAPTKLIIGCGRVELFDADGDCPFKPGINEYSTQGFPDAQVLELPAIAPGAAVVVEVPHWRDDLMMAASGQTYEFRVEVDPDNSVAESNEDNNVAMSTLVVY